MTRYTNWIYAPRVHPWYYRITLEHQLAAAALLVIIACVGVRGMS